MKNKKYEKRDFQVSFIRPYKVRKAQNKKGPRSLLAYLNGRAIISLNEAYIKAIFAKKDPA